MHLVAFGVHGVKGAVDRGRLKPDLLHGVDFAGVRLLAGKDGFAYTEVSAAAGAIGGDAWGTFMTRRGHSGKFHTSLTDFTSAMDFRLGREVAYPKTLQLSKV